ncbi:MAG: prephenate dehydrogenase [Opitutales bacterium]|nr:prephenate dehydrogenase [Opitutales bacterium]
MIFLDKVAILGAGLLGASLARALKEKAVVGAISVWSRSDSTRQKCAKLTGVFDEVCATPQEAVVNADVVVLCTPTEHIPVLAKQIVSSLKKGAVVTDVGSVKSKICKECSSIINNGDLFFVGSHPMAGSEKIGVDFSDASLFEGRCCFVVADNSQAVNKISKMWEIVGMKVYNVTSTQHDAIVARVSHLPHLLAGTLCLVSSQYSEELLKYVGPGFCDTTRVASGSPDIWDSIIVDNKLEILSALKDYAKNLDELINQIASDDKPSIAQRLRNAKNFRDKLL